MLQSDLILFFYPSKQKKGPGAYPSWERDWSTGSFCLVNRNYDSDHDDWKLLLQVL